MYIMLIVIHNSIDTVSMVCVFHCFFYESVYDTVYLSRDVVEINKNTVQLHTIQYNADNFLVLTCQHYRKSML